MKTFAPVLLLLVAGGMTSAETAKPFAGISVSAGITTRTSTPRTSARPVLPGIETLLANVPKGPRGLGVS